MSYIKFDENGNKYGIKTVSYNRYNVLKNGQLEEVCDTYEEAQHYIDNVV